MTSLRPSSEEPQGLIPQPMFICQFMSRSVVLCSHTSISTCVHWGDAASCPVSSRSGTMAKSTSVAVGNVLSRSVGKLSDLNFALYFHAI